MDSDCGDVCGVETKDGIVLSTLYISKSTPKYHVEKFMTRHFAWVSRDETTSMVIVGDFNVDISEQKRNGSLSLYEKGLVWSATQELSKGHV